MAIRSIDDAIAGAQDCWLFGPRNVFMTGGVYQSMWATMGGAYSSALAGANLSNSDASPPGYLAGASFPFIDPTPSPDSKETYLNRWIFCNGLQPGLALLYDALWHNGGFTITSTSVQTINSAAFPPRDENGSSDGYGVNLALFVETGTGAASPTITVTYTNSDGTSGRTSTRAGSNSWGAGWFVPLPLQEDDKGVRSVQSLQLSASWISGVIHLVAYRPISILELINTGLSTETDFAMNGLTQLYPGTVPVLACQTLTGTSTYLITSTISYLQG
jgi:hypothetical protein